MLLGRPWLFDRRVFHDRKENTYKFEKNGDHNKLKPMAESKVAMMGNNGNKISGSNTS